MKIGIDFGTSFSVSAAFTLRELNLIREAARDVAGLKVFGLIRESVAEAVAYFNAPAGEDEKTILAYDLGGFFPTLKFAA